MDIQTKINTFIGLAQRRIAEGSLVLAKELNEAYVSEEYSDLLIELSDVIYTLTSDHCFWTDFQKEVVVDYYTRLAELDSIASNPLEELKTLTSSGKGTITDPAIVGDINELKKDVGTLTTDFNGYKTTTNNRLDVLESKPDVPQSVLDEIANNTSKSHTHTNKDVLDRLAQSDLDLIPTFSGHINNKGIHITDLERTNWNDKVSQSQLTTGLDGKADKVHNHDMSDINGLQSAFDGLKPEKGDPGKDGISPKLAIGTITEGYPMSVSLQEEGTSNYLMNFVLQKGDKGDPFTINKVGISSSRLDPVFNDVYENYSYLGTDNGILYLRHRTENGIDIPATSPSGWNEIPFIGASGWSPVLGVVTLSSGNSVLSLIDWVGGSGAKPSIGTPGNPTYLGVNGFTQFESEAISVNGSKGDQGDVGKVGFPDASGNTSDRGTYNDRPKDFIFYDLETGLIYIKNSDTSGDWSNGYTWRGPKGDKGDSSSSNITSDITATGVGEVGGISDGDVIATGTSFQDYVTRQLRKRVPATYKQPEISTNVVRSKFASGTESIVTVEIAGNAYDAGDFTSVKLEVSTPNGIKTETHAITGKTFNQTLGVGQCYGVDELRNATVTAYYSGGVQKQDNFGDNSGSPIQAGSVSKVDKIQYIYPIFLFTRDSNIFSSGDYQNMVGGLEDNLEYTVQNAAHKYLLVCYPSTATLDSVVHTGGFSYNLKKVLKTSTQTITMPIGGTVDYKVGALHVPDGFGDLDQKFNMKITR